MSENATQEKLRLLVVDDESATRSLLRDACDADGHRVSVAESAEQALEMLDQAQFDLVLTDLRMDGLSGIDLLKRIVERKEDTGVMLITGYATLDSAMEAMRHGAFDVVQKPINLETLSNKICEFIRKRAVATAGSKDSGAGAKRVDAAEKDAVGSVEIQRVEPPQMRPAQSSEDASSIDKILDIPVQATVRLGKTNLLIGDLLKLGSGSVIELNRHTGEPVELLVNSKLVALGEVVVVNETFGLRVTSIIDHKQRIQSLA